VVNRQDQGRALIRGDLIFPHETVVTVDGRVQLKFTDGGLASLKPHTEYRIDEYNYSGAADGNERSFFNLLKGSVRFVTGAVGKLNRKNFRISTKTATIGIRGSSGLVESCVAGSCAGKLDGTYLSGYEGILTLTSGPFSGDVYPNETYFCAAGGEGCVLLNGGAPPQSDAALPQFDRRYQQGEQITHPPSEHSVEPIAPPAPEVYHPNY
jgi:hypothetical protein